MVVGAVLALGLGGANAAFASKAPPPASPATVPYVTIIPEANPIYLAAGQTQGVANVAIETNGGPGGLSICVNHGGADLGVAGTPVTTTHQQIPVFLGQPNIVKVYWHPTQGTFVACGIGDELMVASDGLNVLQASKHFPCLACVSPLPTVAVAELS